MKDAVRFELGQTVYFSVGEQKGIVTGITFRANGPIYLVTWAHDLVERWHAAAELADSPRFEATGGGTDKA